MDFDIGENQLEYEGVLETPLFALLSNRLRVVADLHQRLAGLHRGISSFSFESPADGSVDTTLTVDLQSHGTYHLGYEQIRWILPAAWSWEWNPDVLVRTGEWLRSAMPRVSFQSHVFTYEAHGWILGAGSAREFLLGLGSPALDRLGENDGTGLIFHFSYPSHNWYVHLMIDHSHINPGGLFVQMVTTIEGDLASYQETVDWMRGLFREALAKLGLQIVTGVG